MNIKSDSVHSLRKQGFKVEVTHRRIYKYVRNGVVHTTKPLSRYEASIRLLSYEEREGLQSKGGSTTVVVLHNGKEFFNTTVLCSKNDNFNPKTGVKIAMERMVKKCFETLCNEGYRWAFYSEQYSKIYGTVVYKSLDGMNTIECSFLANDPSGEFYKWDDKVFVDIVKTDGFVRRNDGPYTLKYKY